MGCACGGKKKVHSLFPNSEKNNLIQTDKVNNFYIIDLCAGYKLKYKTNVFYLETPEGEILLTSAEEITEWAKDNCDGLEL